MPSRIPRQNSGEVPPLSVRSSSSERLAVPTGRKRSTNSRDDDTLHRHRVRISTVAHMLHDEHGRLTFPPLWVLYNAPPSLLHNRRCDVEHKPPEVPFFACSKSDKSCQIFKPDHVMRKVAHRILSFRAYIWIMLLVVIADLIHPQHGAPGHAPAVEWMFIVIYLVECGLKMLALGVCCKKEAYFTNPWNVLDFILVNIMIANQLFSRIIDSEGYRGDEKATERWADVVHVMNALHSLRAVRIFRTVYTFKALRTLIATIANSIKSLSQVLVLSCFWLVIFALVGMELFMGKFKHRCVLELPDSYQEPLMNMTTWNTTNLPLITSTYDIQVAGIVEDTTLSSDQLYQQWIYNKSNWEPKFDWEGDYWLCGNVTGARGCGSGYACLELPFADNPYNGKQSFDDFGDALITAMQLTVLDEWTNVYRKVVETSGPFSTIYFIIIVFFGGFQLINTVLALINLAYESEVERQATREALVKKIQEEEGIEVEIEDSSNILEYPRGSSRATIIFKDASPNISTAPFPHLSAQTSSAFSRPLLQVGVYQDTVSAADVRFDNLVEKSENKFLGSNLLKPPDPAVLSMTSTNSRRSMRTALSALDSRLSVKSFVAHRRPKYQPTSRIRYNPQPSTSTSTAKTSPTCCSKFIDEVKDFHECLEEATTSKPFELFIGLVILCNVIVMAMEGPEIGHKMQDFLIRANRSFTTIFCIEAFVKIVAQGREYFKSKWNLFDLVISIISLVDVAASGNLAGVTVFRAFRLVRVVRLAKLWPTMKRLLSTVNKSLPVIANMSIITCLVILIFTLIGMNGLSHYYEYREDGRRPRWRFDDLPHSLALTYIIFCGEFIEPLFECFEGAKESKAGKPLCLSIIIPIYIIGNLLILNLYVSIILSSFGSVFEENEIEAHNIKDIIKNKLRTQWTRIRHGLGFRSRTSLSHQNELNSRYLLPDQYHIKARDEVIHSTRSRNDAVLLEMIVPKGRSYAHTNPDVYVSVSEQSLRLPPIESYETPEETVVREPFILGGTPITFKKCRVRKDLHAVDVQSKSQTPQHPGFISSAAFLETETRRFEKERAIKAREEKIKDSSEKKIKKSDKASRNDVVIESIHELDKELDSMKMGGWKMFRQSLNRLISTWYFEIFIIFCIFISTVALGLEDIYLPFRPILAQVLSITNLVLIVVFTLEFMVRIIAMGPISYLTNLWCLLDLCTLALSIGDAAYQSAGGEGTRELAALRSLRAARALRPLRVVNHWDGMKVVVNSLLISLPSVGNVLLLCCVAFLIFSIVAVTLFSGKMHYCHERMTPGDIISPRIVQDRIQCESRNLTWSKPFWNFDNVGSAYFFLFGMVTFDNWIEAMIATSDAWEPGKQPVEEQNYFWSISFIVIFSLIGSLFLFNLFIGVMIDSFNRLKKQLEGHNYAESLMTESQRHYYHMLKKLGHARKVVTFEVPEGCFRRRLYNFVTHAAFENSVMALVVLNIAVMCFDRYNQSQTQTDWLSTADLIFVTIFTVEFILKLMALSYHYFKSLWNLFDFIIVIVTLTGSILEQLGHVGILLINPTIFRCGRVFRIARALKLVHRAAGLRRILISMLMSLPALCNIAALLLLVVVVYSVIGMQLFMYVRPVKRLNEIFNFQTIGGSMMVMFRMMTGVGWTFVLESLAIQPPFCNQTHATLPNGDKIEVDNGDCGSLYSTTFFCITYVIITFNIIVNCYIALILDNFEEQSKDSKLIGEEDISQFYDVWNQFDVKRTQFIRYNQLSDFLDSLPPPLRVRKPNTIAISILNINVSTGMKIHCLDLLQRIILHSLSAEDDNFGLSNIPPHILNTIATQYQKHYPEYLDVAVMSTTKELALTEYAIRKIQRWWRNKDSPLNAEYRYSTDAVSIYSQIS